MAQLKDSIITGSLRVTDTIFSTNLNLSSLTASQAVLTDANKNLVSRAITNNTSATAVSATTNLITENTLYYHKGNSNIVTVGTVTTGTWSATTIAVNKGGTGLTTSTYKNAIIAGNTSTATNAFSTIRTASGALYATAQDGAASFGTLPVQQGGTGLTTATNKNAIITGNGTTANSAFTTVRTGSGAFYATAQDGAATFGTLPIAQGGTGTSTAPTQWGIIYASTTTAYASTGAGTAGYLLQSNATSAPTWIQATNANTASTIVKRDGSGNFSAGTITASLSGNATSADRLVSRGNVTCETGANVPAVNGVSMSQVYNNGYPTTYGNVLTMKGAGSGQLLLGWSGTSGARANAYIRSKRDSADANWSDWYTLVDSGNVSTFNTFDCPLTVKAQNTTNEGGELVLKADPDHSAYDAHLDVCNQVFRLHSNGSERFSVNLGTGYTNITGGNLDNSLVYRATTDTGTYCQMGIAGNGRQGIYSNGYITVSDSVRTHTDSNAWLIYRDYSDGKVHSPTYIDAVIKTYEKAYSSLPANSSVNYKANEMSPAVSTPTGYKPAAILSFTTGSGDACMCAIYGQSTGTSGFVTIRNISNSAITNKTIVVKMLYLKVDT